VEQQSLGILGLTNMLPHISVIRACVNSHTIALISHASKILPRIIKK